MVTEYRFTCPLPLGMHARPASALEEAARGFADVSLVNERTGHSANARSVLGIVGLDIRMGDPCRVVAAGPDARRAMATIRAFVDEVLPRCADALPAVEPARPDAALPPALRRAGSAVLHGTPVVRGIGHGRAVSLRAFSIPESIPLGGVDDVAGEVGRIEDAIDRLARSYDAHLAAQDGGVASDVLRAHRAVARDPEFGRRIVDDVRAHRHTAAGAIAETEAHFAGMLAATGSALLRERALDLGDVCRQLLRAVYGDALPDDEIRLTSDAVCLAGALTPEQFLAIDRRWLKGLVLAHGGTTSHTVILARSFGVPTLVGVTDLDPAALDGREVVVDADLGVLVTHVNEGARRYYEMEGRRVEQRRAYVRQFIHRPAATEDGQRVEVTANIASAADVRPALAAGADGVGLFRTEALFLERKEAPSEDEQFEEYRRALVEAGGRHVIIRTLDVGGDKPVPYLRLPRENNPFLGCRAVRAYPALEPDFRAQVRALVRASAFGHLGVMVPLISRVEEVTWVRGIIRDEQARLAAAGVAFDAAMEVGAMIEVPAAAFLLDPLCHALDFFSIGTNDLLQYFTAADRGNEQLAALLEPLEPSFIRLLDQIVRQVHARGRRVGLCGEMGGQPRCLPVLVGLGLDDISMAAPGIAEARAAIADLSAAGCRALVGRAVNAASHGEVESLLDAADYQRRWPLVEPALIGLRADCQSKEEAIKAGVDLLYAARRTDRPRDVEEAVWRREAVYSTGFGHGFAIPHCRTDAVRANSLAVVRLDRGVEWGSLDEQPVGVVILLAVRESDEAAAHMKALAALARRLMHEEFREEFMRGSDPETLCRLLTSS